MTFFGTAIEIYMHYVQGKARLPKLNPTDEIRKSFDYRVRVIKFCRNMYDFEEREVEINDLIKKRRYEGYKLGCIELMCNNAFASMSENLLSIEPLRKTSVIDGYNDINMKYEINIKNKKKRGRKKKISKIFDGIKDECSFYLTPERIFGENGCYSNFNSSHAYKVIEAMRNRE